MQSSKAKLLTVAVPAYNAEWCLEKCLSSFVTSPASDSLEVIVVNDGSTDNTRAIALKNAEKYPQVIKLLDKENGGHGSTINAAIRQATGKYFKVVDADDWIITENLARFVDILSNTEADAIITHFHTVDMQSGERRKYKTRGIPLNEQYTIDGFTSYSGEIFQCAALHGLTYRTDVYRDSKTEITEGIFYVDQEYATLPFTKVRTMLPLDMFFYEYLVGNVSQSVSDSNLAKRLNQVEQVMFRLFRCLADNPSLPVGAYRYIARKATDMLKYYYIAALVKNPDKPDGLKGAARVRQEIKETQPILAKKADLQYNIAVLMNKLGFTGRTLDIMKHPLPYMLYRKLFKRNRK